MVRRMALDKVSQLRGMVALIQHIAANDEIKLTQQGVLTFPVTALVSHHGQGVQDQIGL